MPRGRYDRTASAATRAADQRRALLRAAAEALEEVGSVSMTVDRVLSRVELGRNTFYAHFDGVGSLLDALEEFACGALFERVEADLRDARTPLEQLRAAALAWLEAAAADALLARVALHWVVGARPGKATSEAQRRWTELLTSFVRTARRDGLAFASADRVRTASLAAMFCAAGLRAATEPVDVHMTADALVDVVARVLR